MSTCPECDSKELYQYKDAIETTTISGDLLPNLGSGIFTSAKVRPVICANCGNLKLYVSKAAIEKMKTSEHWKEV